MTKIHTFLALALLLASTSFANADIPDPDGACDGDEPAGVQCRVVAGPGFLSFKGPVFVGTTFCQDETVDLPLQCGGNSGDFGGVGGASFGDGNWSGGARYFSINVVNDQETCTAATSPPCGFTVEICNDRDLDSICTNAGDYDDELAETAASEGVLGSCKDEKKSCADPNEAGWSGCLSASVLGTWAEGQLIVLVGAEAGVDIEGNPDAQAAVSLGTFTIWVEDQGATSECHEDDDRPLPACSDGFDNDRDGLADASDPGCHTDEDPGNAGSYDSTDEDEQNAQRAQCTDGHDNDFDGRADSLDPACHTDRDPANQGSYDPSIEDESDPACSDGRDNDGDGVSDAADGGCHTDGNATSTGTYDQWDGSEENPTCGDGIDNDQDTRIDADDPGCSGASDTSERGSDTCDDGQDNDGDNLIDSPEDPGCSDPTDGDEADSGESGRVACSTVSRGGDEGEETFIDIEGPAGTTATCTGECPSNGSMVNVAQWNSGPGRIHVSMEGCGNAAGSGAAYDSSTGGNQVGDRVQTASGTFTCTVEVQGDWASGTGMCNDPPLLYIPE